MITQTHYDLDLRLAALTSVRGEPKILLAPDAIVATALIEPATGFIARITIHDLTDSIHQGRPALEVSMRSCALGRRIYQGLAEQIEQRSEYIALMDDVDSGCWARERRADARADAAMDARRARD